MNSPTLVVYGDLSVDIGLGIKDFPTAGLDTAASHQRVTAGGSAANCAVAAARLGVGVDLVARVGDDLFSDLLIGDLERNGVGTSAVERTGGPSALVVALIDSGGQRSFVSSRGPASGPIPPEVYLPRLGEASLAHVSGYSFQDPGSRSVALHLLEEARRRGIPVSLDPSPLFAEDYRTESGWLAGNRLSVPQPARGDRHHREIVAGGGGPGAPGFGSGVGGGNNGKRWMFGSR